MDLSILRFLLSFAILLPSTLFDVKTREVPDELWAIGFTLGLVITLIDGLTGYLDVWPLMLSLVLGCVLGLSMFYLGFFGGADSKSLIFLSLTIPQYPKWITQLALSTPIPVLTVFNNSLILSLCYPLTIAALNIVDLARGRNPLEKLNVEGFASKALLLLTTRRISFEELKRRIGYYPAEQPVESDGKIVRRPVYFMRAETDKEAILRKLEPYADKGLYADGILATPTIPFIAFITIGLTLFPVGDLVLTLVNILIRG